MRQPIATEQIQRLLIVLPNWVGDVVLATPVLAALRRHFQNAGISYLLRPYVQEVVAGGGWHDSDLLWPSRSNPAPAPKSHSLRTQIRNGNFDAAILLTNSFRSAFSVWLGRVPRRLGYARDGRSWLLTHRLKPAKTLGQFVPRPVLDSYCDLAALAGCHVDDRRLRLGITPEQESAATVLKRAHRLDGSGRYAVLNPGAAFGAAKCWLPDRFAEVCNQLSTDLRLRPVLVGGGNEIALMRDIAQRARVDVTCCDNPGTTLGSLKPLVRDAALLVCNDTGPRHYGNAFNVPTVTIFGPTHMEWTNTAYDREIKIQLPVPCGPCQLRTCPIDHRCMTGITTEMVMSAAARLLAAGRPALGGPG